MASLLAEEEATRIKALFQNHDPLQFFISLDGDDDDDDYDEESIISTNTDMFETPSFVAITPVLPIEEPEDSLIMEDEELRTIPEKESDEFIKSSVDDLVSILSESEATSDNESECDLPIFNISLLDVFDDNCMIFSKPLFDSYGDSTSSEYSSDNESFLEEDVFSNLPFKFDIESIPSDIDPIYNEVSEDIDGIIYLIDSNINFSKIDPLLEEFTGELALTNPIPPGIDEFYFDHEEDIHLIEKKLYDNSSPRPPKGLNSEISIKSFSPSPIPIEDSDSLIEEIDTFLESEPDRGELTIIIDLDFTLSTDFSGSNLVVSFPSGNRNKTFDPGISIEVQSKRFLSLNKFSTSFISDPLSLVLKTFLPFSSKNEDKVFNPGILVSKEEKSHLLSYRGFKAFKIIHKFLNESPMMIYEGDIPIWDVSIALDCEDSRARVFVLSMIMEIRYPRLTYRISTKGRKRSQIGQNRARILEEHEKIKPKAQMVKTRHVLLFIITPFPIFTLQSNLPGCPPLIYQLATTHTPACLTSPVMPAFQALPLRERTWRRSRAQNNGMEIKGVDGRWKTLHQTLEDIEDSIKRGSLSHRKLSSVF
ncbi:hypothetical protein Tco_0813400 [Tanacetum coccineum]